MAAKLTPIQTRAQDLTFVARCCFNGLRHRLPLRWPTPPDTPSSPKKAYRSHYVYLGWEDGDHPRSLAPAVSAPMISHPWLRAWAASSGSG